MKQVLSIILLAAALCATSSAQTGERLEQVAQRLQLTSEQRAQIGPILAEQAEKLQALRAKADGDNSRRQKRQLAKELRDVQQNFDKRITPLLNATQKAEWKKLREERREQLKQQVR
jgi:periplasmic protein CpxP/Spy